MAELAPPAAPAARLRNSRAAVREALGRAGLLLSALVVAVAIGWAFLPGLFTEHSPYAVDPISRYLPPGGGHWFGTDHLGRDIFARIVHGAALSLQAAVVAVLIGLLAGTATGLVAAQSGGWLDNLLMRLVDVSLAIPGLLLSLLIVTALGFGTMNVAIAVGIGAVPAFARVMRAETLRVMVSPYYEAAGAYGVGRRGLLLRHVLPNAAAPALALAPLEFGSAILSVATLGFLGYGALPPEPEWGAMVADGRNYLRSYWWIAILPGAVVVAVVIATTTLSRAIQARFGS